MKKPVEQRPPRAGGTARDARAAPGKVRLIGGRWRGTRLPVADVPGLRPTSDRVRETVFNWLMPRLPGARVLDLFAGTGALGLEALSRGAASAVLVECERSLAASLQELASRLPGGDAARVERADALQWLQVQRPAQFDIAFVDPPFTADLWRKVLPLLLPTLRADAWVYVETPIDAADEAVPMPHDWRLHRQGSTREVRYALYRRSPAAADTLPTDLQPREPLISSEVARAVDGALAGHARKRLIRGSLSGHAPDWRRLNQSGMDLFRHLLCNRAGRNGRAHWT